MAPVWAEPRDGLMFCYNCFHDTPDAGAYCPRCGHRFDEANPKGTLPAGSILNGRYIVGHVLGQGGFGITYKAYDHKRDRVVALKEYYPGALCDRAKNRVSVEATSGSIDDFSWGLAQFLKEADTLARLSGVPGITHVHEYFEENGTAYFCMDYVEGQDLLHWVDARGGKVGWDELAGVVRPVMEALSTVHQTGLIHRDVTPENIVVDGKGHGVLLDFGAARVSLAGRSQSLSVVLKRGYAPKEQYFRRGHQGPWTDVYAMGATIYRCLTGKVPTESLQRADSLAQGRTDPLRPPSDYAKVDRRVEKAVTKALEVDASRRYQTMGEFAAALPAPGPKPKPGPRPPKPPTPPKPPISDHPTPDHSVPEPPTPPDSKEVYQKKLDQAAAEGLGMKWYKFVIYVQCFLSGAGCLLYGLVRLTGSEYGSNRAGVYLLFPSLQVLNVIDGLALIALGVAFFYARSQLKRFTDTGRKLYLATWTTSLVVSILYVLIWSSLVGTSAVISNNAASIFGTALVAAYNFYYFSKRKHLFED